MTEDPKFRPPVLSRLLVYAASWVAPADLRTAWRARWDSILGSWWALVQRGEWISDGPADLVERGREAFADAANLRFGRDGLRRIASSPVLILSSLALAIVTLALGSSGFAYTRMLLTDASDYDRIVGHGLALAFALVIAVAFAVRLRLSLESRSLRYWTFFAAKTLTSAFVVTLAWIEAGAAIRAALPAGGARVLLGGLAPTLVFLAAFPLAVGWSVTDQRQRCPACLDRLVLPVTIGTWSSMMEPPATELLCPHGHGALCAPETESGAPEHWTSHDESWAGIFHG